MVTSLKKTKMAPTCCTELGEKYFYFLNQAFISDPEIDEVDVIPCFDCCGKQNKETEDFIILVNHKLGIKSCCLRPLFLFAYKMLLKRCRQREKDCSLSVTETVQLSRAVLLVNAECYTVWNIRKELISAGVLSLEDDIKCSALVLSKHPRSAETFAHRRWTIEQLEKLKGQDEFVHRCLRGELAISLRAAESYADNYTAWSHRSWLVERFMKDRKKRLFCELQVMRKWTERHISDNCGFHHRQVLLKYLKNVCSHSEVLHLLLSELEFTSDLILTFPGHEVIWYHRRFVYHFWNKFCTPGTSLGTLQEISGSSKIGDNNSLENCNRISRRSSPSTIPSLFDLASSSFNLLRELKSGFNSWTSVSKELTNDDMLVPLSTPSELRFCNDVVIRCQSVEGEIQRRFASNYKKWLLLQSKCSSDGCNVEVSSTGEAATES